MKRTVLTNMQLIDGVSTKPQEDRVVVIAGDRITWIGSRAEWETVKDPADEVLDLKGMYVLPGLWDMHLHLDYRGLKDGQAQPSLADDVLFSYRRALTFLHWGVTSLRLVSTHNGIDFALRDGIASGEYVGPRIFTAGPGIASTGGHGSVDGKGCDGPYEFRRSAREVVFRGADLVKVMVTGGIAGRHEAFDAPQTMRDEVAATVEVAHNWGKHVSAHVASAQAAVMCAEAGVNTIEHGYALDENALRVMKKHGCVYVPTLVVTDNPSYWEEIGTAQWAVDKIKQAYDSHHKAVKMALDMGITITLGSDVPTPFMDGTVVVVREMEALAKLGAAPRDIISWATKVPARVCGVDAEVGTLERGKVADLIAVPNDPYDSVSHLRDVSFVMAKGVVVRDEVTGKAGANLLAGYLED